MHGDCPRAINHPICALLSTPSPFANPMPPPISVYWFQTFCICWGSPHHATRNFRCSPQSCAPGLRERPMHSSWPEAMPTLF